MMKSLLRTVEMKILKSPIDNIRVVAEKPQGCVALVAQQSSQLSSGVAVVDCKPYRLGSPSCRMRIPVPANCTLSILALKKGVERLGGDAISIFKPSLLSDVRMRFVPRPCLGLIFLGPTVGPNAFSVFPIPTCRPLSHLARVFNICCLFPRQHLFSMLVVVSLRVHSVVLRSSHN